MPKMLTALLAIVAVSACSNVAEPEPIDFGDTVEACEARGGVVTREYRPDGTFMFYCTE